MADERNTNVNEALTQSSNYKEETAAELGDAVPARAAVNTNPDAQIGASVPIRSAAHREETAAEIAAPVPLIRNRDRDVREDRTERAAGGAGLGTVALALSILSLFVLPILFGAAGIVLGFVARRRGAEGLGAWAIGIGAVSIIIGIFILPFF